MDSYDDSGPAAVSHLHAWLNGLGAVLIAGFYIWMIVDAIRRQEWIWVAIMVFFPGLSTVLYFFLVFRGPSAMRGFELPGSQSRQRVKELQAQIHLLDKAHHHSQLGDVYFQQGKLAKAETSYRAALERDPNDLDTQAHLGQCLLRLKRPAEAKPLLQAVLRENPKHEYNYTAMAYAETLAALGETEDALKSWQFVVANNSYPRAKVQLAELYLAKNQPDLARAELSAVLTEDPHAPAFQRKRDRVWVSRARGLLRKLPK